LVAVLLRFGADKDLPIGVMLPHTQVEPYSTSELYRPSDRRLSAKLVRTFADRGCRTVSATFLYARILDFLDRSRYFFFPVAPELHSRSSVYPVPDTPYLRNSGSAGNRTRTSASVTMNSARFGAYLSSHSETLI
jgi:hypothetical protein